jgi:cell division protein FtsZ
MNEAEENTYVEEEHASNGLENFGVEGETSPDLFTSDNDTTETNEDSSEDDDLEIPAFLRRQKN